MSENQNSSCKQGVEKYFFRASTEDFKKIPGRPIAYWVGKEEFDAYKKGEFLDAVSYPRKGLDTGENAKFLRLWHEVSYDRTCFDGHDLNQVWFPYNKGGEFRRWYGNREYVINWKDDGNEIKSRLGWDEKKPTIRNAGFYFRECFTWTTVSSGSFSARYCPVGALFDNGGCSLFADSGIFSIGGFINSKVMFRHLGILSPTLNFQPGDIAKVPFHKDLISRFTPAQECSSLSKSDWDSYEISWDFTSLPLLRPDYRQSTLKANYEQLRADWRAMTQVLQRLEEENNRIFIDAYGLQDELDKKVELSEITLTCNPYYRYGDNKSEEDLEALLLADTMRELVSYAVGCMFGRYSLDKPGLILANQGETLADYLAQVPAPSFPADDDNVIPLLDGDWFADEVTLRFRQFLRVAFGDAHYEDNLAFIEQALNVKGKRNYGLRDYLLGEFYTDHVKRYKKRPIYWLFSSPRGSFNALVYMHRYQPDTVSVVLRYLREYRAKLLTEKERQAAVSINPGSSQGEKTKALKEVDRLAKVLAELDDYERDTLYPLATEQKAIDLDDGVKVNYLKFGAALKKITGLEAKDED